MREYFSPAHTAEHIMNRTVGLFQKFDREKIISVLKENGHNTTKPLAELLGLSTKAIEKQLAKLKAEGIIRIGPDESWFWEVVK